MKWSGTRLVEHTFTMRNSAWAIDWLFGESEVAEGYRLGRGKPGRYLYVSRLQIKVIGRWWGEDEYMRLASSPAARREIRGRGNPLPARFEVEQRDWDDVPRVDLFRGTTRHRGPFSRGPSGGWWTARKDAAEQYLSSSKRPAAKHVAARRFRDPSGADEVLLHTVLTPKSAMAGWLNGVIETKYHSEYHFDQAAWLHKDVLE